MGAGIDAQLTLTYLLRLDGHYAWEAGRELLPQMPPLTSPALADAILDTAPSQPDPFDRWLGQVEWSKLSWSPRAEQLDDLLDRLWQDYSAETPRRPARWTTALDCVAVLVRMGEAKPAVGTVFDRYTDAIPEDPSEFEAREADFGLLDMFAAHGLVSGEEAARITLRDVTATLTTVRDDNPYVDDAQAHIVRRVFPAIDAAREGHFEELERSLNNAGGLGEVERDAILLALFARRRRTSARVRIPIARARIPQLASDASGARAAGMWLASARPNFEQAWPVIRAGLISGNEGAMGSDLRSYMARLSERRRAALVQQIGLLYVDGHVRAASIRVLLLGHGLSDNSCVAIVDAAYDHASNNKERKRALSLATEFGIDDPAAQERLFDRVIRPALRQGKGAATDAINALDLTVHLAAVATKRDRAVARARKRFQL